MTDPTFLSKQFRRAAVEERATIQADLDAITVRLDELAAEAAELSKRRSDLSAALRSVEEILGVSSQLSLDVTPAFSGRELRDRAIRLLVDEGVNEPIHYSVWFRKLIDAGVQVKGKDPLATFLAQISRDERIERIGSRTGMYKLAN